MRMPLAEGDKQGTGSLSFFRRKGEEERPQPAPGLAAGKVVGEFRLVGLIGQGGMGQVWEAEQARAEAARGGEVRAAGARDGAPARALRA